MDVTQRERPRYRQRQRQLGEGYLAQRRLRQQRQRLKIARFVPFLCESRYMPLDRTLEYPRSLTVAFLRRARNFISQRMKRIISSFRCLRFVKKNYLVSKKTSLESRTGSFVSCSGQASQELAGAMEVGGKLRELRAKNYHHWNARVKNSQLISNKGLGLPFLKSLGSKRGFILVPVYQSGAMQDFLQWLPRQQLELQGWQDGRLCPAWAGTY